MTDNALNVTGTTQQVALNGSIPATGGTTTPTVTVSPSPTSITTAQADTVTIGVSGGSGNPTPTGPVTLTSGSYTSAPATPCQWQRDDYDPRRIAGDRHRYFVGDLHPGLGELIDL